MIFKYGYILFMTIVAASFVLVLSLINNFHLFVHFHMLDQNFNLLLLNWRISIINFRHSLHPGSGQGLVSVIIVIIVVIEHRQTLLFAKMKYNYI